MGLNKMVEDAKAKQAKITPETSKRNKKILRWATIGLLIIAALIVLIPEPEKSADNNTKENLTPSKNNTNTNTADFTTTSTDYSNEYIVNKMEAENKYFGRSLIIEGVIESIGKNEDNYNIVYLKGKNEYKVSCLIRQDQDISNSKPGMDIKILGVSHGRKDNLLSIVDGKILQ